MKQDYSNTSEAYLRLRKRIPPGRTAAINISGWGGSGLIVGLGLKYLTNGLSNEIGGVNDEIGQFMTKVDGVRNKAVVLGIKAENILRKKAGKEEREIPQVQVYSGIGQLDDLAGRVDGIGSYGFGITTLLGLAIGAVVAYKKIRSNRNIRAIAGELDRLKERMEKLESKSDSLTEPPEM